MIDIRGMDKAVVLARLYNAARAQGLGLLVSNNKDMTPEEARAYLANSGQTYIDYLNGRVLKVELGDELLDPRKYDRDNGPGAAAAALGLNTEEGKP